LLELARKVLPQSLRRFLANQLFGVTPGVPVTLLDLSARAPAIRGLWSGIALGWVFCFGGTLLTTWLAGTLDGAAPGRLFFLHDNTNLINYTVLCPAYLGLSCAFVILVLQGWNRVRNAPLVRGSSHRAPRLPLAFLALLVVGAAAALTTNYIRECLTPEVYARAAWYASVSADGERSLNIAGIYYTILNFFLLLVSLVAFMAIGVFACTAAEIARALRSSAPSSHLKFEGLQKLLTEFTLAYIVAKLLAVTYMLNAYTWKWEQPHGSFNLPLMVVFLAVVGVLVVSFPRYYVEIEWFQFKVRRAEALTQPVPRESDDIRSLWIRDVAFVIDLFFGLGFITSFLL